MLRTISLLCVLMAIFTGCTLFSPGNVTQSIDPTEVSRVIVTFSEKMRYEKHLELDDSIIYYDKNINRIKLVYSTMDSLYLQEAREVLVDLTEELLDRLNGNALISPQLGSNPFTAANLEIYINFPSFYTNLSDQLMVGLVCLRNGVTHYIAADGIDCNLECWHKRQEYYYQSKNMVDFKRQGDALYKPKAPGYKVHESIKEVYFTQ